MATINARRMQGLPDWRDAHAYPAVLSDHVWRWEFLRRKDEYRRDWRRCYPATVKWYQSHKFAEFFTGRAPGDGRAFADNWGCDSTHPRFLVHMKGSVSKYGLRGLPNPAIARPDNLPFEGRFDVPIVFDISEPIEELEQQASRAFKSLKKLYGASNARKQRRLWSKYLRALDADADGASYAEICAALDPRSKRPRARGQEIMKAAYELQELITRPK